MKTNAFTKRFTKKLKSNTGASILLALAFFLMCFFVASVVMASASVNASRALAQKEEQRSFFAIQSAQNLIKGMFGEINGENRTANMKKVLLDYDRDSSGAEVFDDSGNRIEISATTYGGFHLREVNTVYDWCNEGRTYALYGVPDLDATNNLQKNSVTNPTDILYKNSEFGLYCIGDDTGVFLKDSIEEVASLALCKRLFDQGVNSLDGYGTMSTYFSKVDKNFNLANNPDYTYYFDIAPDSGSGVYVKNIPTVHVKMTADNNANLYFELTVDSRYSATYSASVRVLATIDTSTPTNKFLKNPNIWDEECAQRTTPEKQEFHHVTKTITDTFVAWYTKDIEITKGVKKSN